MKLHLLSLGLLLLSSCLLVYGIITQEQLTVGRLHFACHNCNVSMVEDIYIQENYTINPFAVLREDIGLSPAQLAKNNTCDEIIFFFDQLNYNGLVQLYVACERGDLEEVRRLREKYPWIDPTSRIQSVNASPMQMALAKGHLHIADYLSGRLEMKRIPTILLPRTHRFPQILNFNLVMYILCTK